MKRHSDEEIIGLLFERNEKALGIIQELYGKLIRTTAFNLFNNENVADECLNDTLLAIWNTIPPEKPNSIVAYACAISRRKAIDRLRKDTAQKRSGFDEICDEFSFAEDFSENIVNNMELARVMNSFLASLSPSNREIFMYRYFDFESLDSISAKMHISKNRLGAKLFRMREKLSDMLRKEGVTE